jgi:hypothetical protein
LKKTIIICIFGFLAHHVEAQLFGRRDIGVHQGIMSFHNPSLNNKNNNNNKTSWVTEVDKNLYLSRFASFNAGLGIGNYKNLDDKFAKYESYSFYRIKAGLVLHLPQSYSPRDLTPNAFNPFLKAAYNFDISDQHFENRGGNRLIGSFRLGCGFVIRASHHLGIMYEFSHNQRLASDYRTFFQHNFGILINLEEPYKPY